MISLDPNEPRYAMLPLFLAMLAMVLAAPVFWLLTEIRGASVADSFQNADLYQFYYPLYQYAFSRLGTGDLPLWSATQLCGMPVQADPRLGLFQPLHAVFLWFPTERAMAIHAYACLALIGSGFVLYARSLGVGYWAAMMGALVFAFCGATAGAMSRPDAAATLAWAPFMAWGAAMYLQRFHLGAAVLAGIGGALMILGGAYALVLLFALLAAPIAAWCILHPPDPRAPGLALRTAGLALAVGIALALSAVQWMPAAVWAHDRHGAWQAIFHVPLAVQKPLDLADLFTQFLRTMQGTQPRLAYIGVGGLLLLPAALFNRPNWRAVAYFAAAAPVLLLVAYRGAPNLPVVLPAEAFAIAAMFALASLAGLGADRLLIPRSVPHAPGLLVPLGMVTAVALLVFLIAPASTRGAVILFAVVATPFLLFRAKWLLPVTGAALSLLLFADLVLASNNTYTHPFMDAAQRFERPAGTLSTAQEEATGGRVLVVGRTTDTALPANLGALAPVRVAGGASIPPTREAAAWWQRMTGTPDLRVGNDALGPGAPYPALLDFMAVRVVLTGQGAVFQGELESPGAPVLRPVRTDADLRVFVNESALPRAYWVPQWESVPGPDAALDRLLAPDFERDRTAVIDLRTPGVPAPPPPGGTVNPLVARTDAPCFIDEIAPEHVQVQVEAPAAGVLVLADTFDRGWTATVNGEPAPVYRVNAMFRGVFVEAGTHTVDFHYQPAAVTAGATTALVALALLALWGAGILIQTLREEA